MRYPEPAVGAVIFNPEEEVLICQSTKWKDKYVIPGGHVEAGEKMEEAVHREVKEETNLDIYDVELFSLKESVYSKDFSDEHHFIFVDYICRTDSYEVLLNEEAQDYEWIDLTEIENYDLEELTRELLKEVRDGEDYSNTVEIFYNYQS